MSRIGLTPARSISRLRVAASPRCTNHPIHTVSSMAGHVQLRRNTRPLLRTVNGQPHARDDDHHEPLPPSEPLAKPADVDINAEPQSTSEDDFSSAETSKPALQAGKQRRGATRIKPPARNTWHFNTREQKLRSKNGEHGVSDTQSSGPSTSGARSNGSPSTQGMDELFGGLGDGPNKRRRTTLKYGSTLNIHSKHAPQTSTGRPAVQCKEASSGTMGVLPSVTVAVVNVVDSMKALLRSSFPPTLEGPAWALWTKHKLRLSGHLQIYALGARTHHSQSRPRRSDSLHLRAHSDQLQQVHASSENLLGLARSHPTNRTATLSS